MGVLKELPITGGSPSQHSRQCMFQAPTRSPLRCARWRLCWNAKMTTALLDRLPTTATSSRPASTAGASKAAQIQSTPAKTRRSKGPFWMPKLIAQEPLVAETDATPLPRPVDGSGYRGPEPPTAPPIERASKAVRLTRSLDVGSSAPTAPPG